MRRGERELAALALAELLAKLLDVLGLQQDAFDPLDQLLAGIGQPNQPLAAADEQLEAKLVF